MAFKALPSRYRRYHRRDYLWFLRFDESANGIATNSGSFAMSTFGSVQLSSMAVEDTRASQFTMGGIAPDVKGSI